LINHRVPTAVDYLRNVAPNWVSVQSGTANVIQILALPIRAGGETGQQYSLEVEVLDATSVVVREHPSGAQLPLWCPERHINQDQSFCMGLVEHNIGNDIDAQRWWNKLQLFLECQEVARDTGRWPVYAQLSHGSAGSTELEAETLAQKLGLLAEYQRAVRFGRGILADAVRHLGPGETLKNGRAKCFCGYVGKRGRPLLRRDCQVSGRNQCLLKLEQRRRTEVQEFWASFPGAVCCGTMEDCPLKKKANANDGALRR